MSDKSLKNLRDKIDKIDQDIYTLIQKRAAHAVQAGKIKSKASPKSSFYKPDRVLNELLRIGKSVIVSIPNFGYWKVRTSLLFFGKMPVTKTLPNIWFNTPNLHMCTIKDLYNYCEDQI